MMRVPRYATASDGHHVCLHPTSVLTLPNGLVRRNPTRYMRMCLSVQDPYLPTIVGGQLIVAEPYNALGSTQISK